MGFREGGSFFRCLTFFIIAYLKTEELFEHQSTLRYWFEQNGDTKYLIIIGNC